MGLRDFDVRDFGAVPDGVTDNTASLQNAIDSCSASGGGRVILTGGTYLSGTISMKDHVELHLAADGVLLGSPRCEDYPDLPWNHVDMHVLPRYQSAAFIRGDACEHIAITGFGTIDCYGDAFVEKSDDPAYWMPYRRIKAPTPPRVIMFAGCRHIRLSGFTMTNQPAGWSVWLTDCDLAAIDDIKLLARMDYPNNDGIHINSSRDVRVSNCTINCGDDALIVRANNTALRENKVCERIAIANCTLSSHSSGIRIGWVNDGTIRNCTFSNIVMTNTTNGIALCLPGPDPRTRDTGREATHVQNLNFSNIVMDDICAYPVCISVAEHPETRCECIKNLYFHGIRATAHQMPRICGRKDAVVENVTFDNCRFEVSPLTAEEDLRLNGFARFGAQPVKSPEWSHTRNVQFNHTEFTVSGD